LNILTSIKKPDCGEFDALSDELERAIVERLGYALSPITEILPDNTVAATVPQTLPGTPCGEKQKS
jgi:hypothetical protein